jgi:hypothetical protein
MESNPEEFKGYDSKWHNVVPTPTGHGEWSHALSPEEIQALKDGIRKIYRKVYTDLVMSTLLYETEEESITKWNDPRMLVSLGGTGGGGTGMLGQGKMVNPYQNAIQPGSWQTVATQPEKLSLTEILKNKLKYSL